MSDEIKKLVTRYREFAGVHANTDFGDARSVKRANDAADKMLLIALEVSRFGELGLVAFAGLLDDPTDKAEVWAAHHILERMNPDELLAQRALRVIEDYSTSDGLDADGEKLWLEQWKSKQQKPVQQVRG
jgi:hypothetical protein